MCTFLGTAGKINKKDIWVPQNRQPFRVSQRTGTGSCGHMFASLKLLLAYIQLRAGCVKNELKSYTVHDSDMFSLDKFLLARKRLAHCEMSADDYVMWSKSMVKSFYSELGGIEKVAEYVGDFFGAALSEYNSRDTEFYRSISNC